jgi:uncharacterized protein (TIGR02594 family)
MFTLKVTVVAVALLLTTSAISSAMAAMIKVKAGSTYSCHIRNNKEICKLINLDTDIQAEWQQEYDTHIHSVASQFIGLHERKNRREIVELISVDPARTPWCAAFLNAILEKIGYEGTGSNHARSFLKYGQSVKEPQVGDIVVLGKHVGIYEGTTYIRGKKYVAVLGGNQRNGVRVSYFPASRVLAYRRVV